MADRILFALIIVYILFEMSRAMQIFSPNKWVLLGVEIAVFTVLVYYLYFRSHKPSLPCRIIATVAGGAYLFLPFVLSSHRTFSLINIALSVIITAALLYTVFFDPKSKGVESTYVLTAEAVAFISRMARYSAYTDEINGFFACKYIYITLIVSLIAGALAYLVLKDKKLPTERKRMTKKDRRANAVFVAACIAVSAAFISYFALGNLNFALDSSAPTSYTCVISDKRASVGGKYKRAYWRVEVEIDGKTEWLDISSSEYSRYKVGDAIEINLYEGFLKEAYLISGNID